MKSFSIAVALAFATLLGAGQASACAMFKARKVPMVVAQNHDKGVKAEKRGELRQAIRLYERAMNGAGKPALRAASATSAARLHLKQGRAERAESRLNRALEIAPKFAEAHAVLAQVKADLGELTAAKAHLARAQELGAPVAAVVAAERAVAGAAKSAGDTGVAQLRL
jgi:tetratricopeptide (TPR) repeat protein